jgi:molybdopterin-containing oxidoreductase family iron-sulfur binding subunit
VSWDNYVTVSNADAKLLEMSNEIVANGGLNGSYATITTADGLKLDNVPVIVQPGQAVGTIGLALGTVSGFERRDASRFKCLRFI